MKSVAFLMGYMNKQATCEETQCTQEEPAGLASIDDSALDNDGNILDRPETAEGESVNKDKQDD